MLGHENSWLLKEVEIFPARPVSRPSESVVATSVPSERQTPALGQHLTAGAARMNWSLQGFVPVTWKTAHHKALRNDLAPGYTARSHWANPALPIQIGLAARIWITGDILPIFQRQISSVPNLLTH